MCLVFVSMPLAVFMSVYAREKVACTCQGVSSYVLVCVCMCACACVCFVCVCRRACVCIHANVCVLACMCVLRRVSDMLPAVFAGFVPTALMSTTSGQQHTPTHNSATLVITAYAENCTIQS